MTTNKQNIKTILRNNYYMLQRIYRARPSYFYLTLFTTLLGSITPVISLNADGAKCVRVKPGEPVTLRAEIVTPPGAGRVTSVRYDFSNHMELDGFPLWQTEGSWIETEQDGVRSAVSELTHSFDAPGVYFPAVRVTAQRNGDREDMFTQVKNLDRVRVIVE